jgi:Cu+-exporting ATPase
MTYKEEMDRVCGMWIEKSTAPFTSQYHGEIFYFCAKECKEQFDQNPEHYMKGFEGRKP